MLEICFHGFGGHGAVMAAKFLADAAARSGFYSQAFASYGALRRGGKVESYVRIAEEPVRPHCKMYRSDYLVFMDEELAHDTVMSERLKPQGSILVNSPRHSESFGRTQGFKVFTVDAYGIAAEKGLVLPGGMPVINTTMVGALLGMVERVDMEDLKAVIREGTPRSEENVECAEEGYLWTTGLCEVKEGHEKSRGETAKGRVPVFHPEKMKKCHHCQICYIFCPSLAIRCEEDPFRLEVEEDLCSGCGICIHECPGGAISWWKGKES